MIEFTDDNFDREVIKSDKPVLVDFWAEWCAPCRMISPIIEEIAKEYEGKIKVGKLNVETYPDIASRYSIMSIPTLLIFKDGKVEDQIIGTVPKKKIKKKLESL
ncbi:thioredoxin [candidate division KSB1 bacterium]|nr:MAG: thioredoxin [candidate division KSB1 bacterium]